MTPLQIRMALAHYCSPEPQQFFSTAERNSGTYSEALDWMFTASFVDGEGRNTDKLTAYAEALMRVPLPVQKWIMPDEEP